MSEKHNDKKSEICFINCSLCGQFLFLQINYKKYCRDFKKLLFVEEKRFLVMV